MTSSTATLTPGTSTVDVSGVGAVAEHDTNPGLRFIPRASRADYSAWLGHIRHAAGCLRPIRLSGRLWEVEPSTGRVVSVRSTDTMPDGVIYTACGNRRATVCPSCAETYRGDAYQLVRAGLVGGKGVPDTVTTHPTVFLTLTAPSFGPVHASSPAKGHTKQHPRYAPCHPRRAPEVCPHGVVFDCRATHTPDDPAVGRPLCLDCYDHDSHVVFNVFAGELWRRTTVTLARLVRRLGKRHGTRLRCSFAKVAEFQARGLVHFHALIRLDAVDPQQPDHPLSPPAGVTAGVLEQLVRQAAEHTTYTTPEHPDHPGGWHLAWGEQIDTRQVRLTVRDVDDRGEITDRAVAGYLAKYATKATEATGHTSARLRPDTVDTYADPATHTGRLIRACWRLGEDPHPWHDVQAREEWARGYGRLRRWAHMLGFGGHFLTKSRRYSTTFAALRDARRAFNRAQAAEHYGPDSERHQADAEEPTLVIGELVFAGMGWHTTPDAILANTAAAKAREQRRVAREEINEGR
jgi:hypothetical protein